MFQGEKLLVKQNGTENLNGFMDVSIELLGEMPIKQTRSEISIDPYYGKAYKRFFFPKSKTKNF